MPYLLLWTANSEHHEFRKGSSHWRRRQWQPTPVFLPGESQGRRSLVGCHLWGRAESDMTEVTQQQQQHGFWDYVLVNTYASTCQVSSFSVHSLKNFTYTCPIISRFFSLSTLTQCLLGPVQLKVTFCFCTLF